MASPSISSITDLTINNGNKYAGPGPVTLKWTPPVCSGNFYDGPYVSLNIEDGDSWGEDGLPSFDDEKMSSYTFTSNIIEHVKNSDIKKADVYVTVWGYDENYNSIRSESNHVEYRYQEAEETSHFTVKIYANGQWQECVIKCYQSSKWIDCIPKYYDGSNWKDCSF